jgi:hypothetical protein
MLKKLLSILVASSLALSPLTASASNEYIYRYKTGLINYAPGGSDPAGPGQPGTSDPDDPTQYGIGNNIDAYFVAPVGYDFSREVPVATRDVVRWVKGTGDIPDGIRLDNSGFLEGKPTAEQEKDALYYGFDASGTRIARAKIFFETFETAGNVQQIDIYDHTGRYFFSQIPTPAGVTVTRWDAVTNNPEGMQTRVGAFEGTPSTAGNYAVAWRGFDYLNREVAFTYGQFVVEDGPSVRDIKDQIADKNEGDDFAVTPKVPHKIGTLSFRLVPVTFRPTGIGFTTDKGEISGVFDAYDTSAKFQIEARDSADGRTGRSNIFALTTTPAVLSLSNIPDLRATVAKDFRQSFSPGVQGVSLLWEIAQGQLPNGIKLDPTTGKISGTPTTPSEFNDIIVRVSGSGIDPVQSNPFKFTVLPNELIVDLEAMHQRVNKPFITKPPSVTEGFLAPMNYASNVHDKRISFDLNTGTYSSEGIDEPGVYDQQLTVQNAVGQIENNYQIIRIYNDLSIAYEPHYDLVRTTAAYVRPTIAPMSMRDPSKFELVQGTLPSWMKFDERSGTFSGTPKEQKDIADLGTFQVRLTDGFDQPIVSEPFTISVVDRAPIALTLLEDRVQRYVGNKSTILEAANGVGKASFKIIDGKIPATLSFDTVRGLLTGTTTDPIGTHYPVTIRATDEDKYTADLAVDLHVVEPWDIDPLDGDLARSFTWSADRSFKDFNIGKVSNGFGPTSYALDDNVWGITLDNFDVNGVFREAGDFTINYTVDDDTARAPAIGAISFHIQPPLALTADAVYNGNVGKALQVRPVKDNGIGPFTYTLEEDSVLPQGMKFDAQLGQVHGTPLVEGDFVSRIVVSDTTGDIKKTEPFTIHVGPPLTFSFSYSGDTVYYQRSEPFLAPDIKNRVGDLKFTLVSGKLPTGLQLVPTGIYAGMINGAATQTGYFNDIVIYGEDLLTGENYTLTLNLRVTKFGSVALADQTNNVRRGAAAKEYPALAGNLVDPYSFALSGHYSSLPGTVLINTTTGTLTAAFYEVDDFEVATKVTDLFNRSAENTVLFHVVDDLKASTPEDMPFQRFVQKQGSVTVENRIGRLSFAMAPDSTALPDGLTLNSSSGVIQGIAIESGVTSGYRIIVTDDFDGQTASTGYFSISISERPQPQIVSKSEQTALMGKLYAIKLMKTGTVGDVSWQMLTSASLLPPGLSFQSETGAIVGTATELGTSEPITIKLTDTYNGEAISTTKNFIFTVKLDGSPILMEVPTEIKARIGFPLTTGIPDVKNTIGDIEWSVSGAEDTGLAFDPVTGQLAGTPDHSFNTSVVVSISDLTGRSTSKTIHIQVFGAITVSMQAESDLIYNYDYKESNGPNPSVTTISGQPAWSIVDPSKLPKGLSLETGTGKFLGKPLQVGAFGPIRLAVHDDLPGVGYSAPFFFTVFMNDDPIELEVQSLTTKVGFPITTAVPFIDNTLGDYYLYSLDLDGTSLSVNRDTGVVTGSFSTPQDRTVNLSITDTTNRVTSKPLALNVLPLMRIVAPSIIAPTAQEEMDDVFITRNFVVGSADWKLENASALPPGVTFDEAKGVFQGTPTASGTFGPVYVTSTDSLGDTGRSDPITFRVEPGALYLTLDSGPLQQATKRIESYSFDLKQYMTAIGFSESGLNWTWNTAGTKLPPGLSLSNGVVSGVATEPGTYNFRVTVTGPSRTASAVYSLIVVTPQVGLQLATADMPEGTTADTLKFDFKPLANATNISLSSLTWSVSGLNLATIQDGVLTEPLEQVAIPDGADFVDQPFTVTARFQDGDETVTATQSYTVRVTKQVEGATYWRVIAVSRFTTPTGSVGFSRLDLRDAALVSAKTMTSNIVSISSSIGAGSSSNYGATIGSSIANVQFIQPVDIRRLYLGHSSSSTSGKLSSVRVESSMDGLAWKTAGTFSLTSAATGTFVFSW